VKIMVICYWLWLAISVGILIRRVIGRLFPAQPRAAAPDSPLDASAPATAPVVLEADLAGTSMPRYELPRPTRSSTPGQRHTLAEALRGIALANDLAPLVTGVDANPDRRAVFSTTRRPLDVVRDELAIELERLGYDYEPLNATDAIARRGDDVVTVRTRRVGPGERPGKGDPAYPTAAVGSVILDLELS
jgi:hypothetical protein